MNERIRLIIANRKENWITEGRVMRVNIKADTNMHILVRDDMTEVYFSDVAGVYQVGGSDCEPVYIEAKEGYTA